MGKQRFTEEFKKEAIGQVLDRGYSVKEVAERLGVSTHSLYIWLKKDSRYGKTSKSEKEADDLKKEVARLKAELKRTEEERDILKKAAAYFASQSD